MEKKKMKLWKKILIVLLVIFLLFLANFVRKYLIFTSIKNKSIENGKETNYHITYYQYSGNSYTTASGYHKGENYIIEHKFFRPESVSQMIRVKKGDKADIYINNGENKVAILNANSSFDVAPFNLGFEDLSTIGFILTSALSKISTDTIYGKECYKISPILCMPGALLPEEGERNYFYIEKDTGLPIRNEYTSVYFSGEGEEKEKVIEEVIHDYFYEFGTVTDEDFVIPNIEEYTIQEQN